MMVDEACRLFIKGRELQGVPDIRAFAAPFFILRLFRTEKYATITER